MVSTEPGMTRRGRIETERLVLRRPCAADSEAVFARYASDATPVKGETLDHSRSYNEVLEEAAQGRGGQ